MLGLAGVLHAQGARIRVAVDIDDSDAGGVLSSAVKSQLRALGDVDVVTMAEAPKLLIDGVALCSPAADCKNFSTLLVSLSLKEPFETNDVRVILSIVNRTAPDSAIGDAASLYASYARVHQTWVAQWGRDRYAAAARELVQRIDEQCFEMRRISNRIFSTMTGETRAKALKSEIAGRKWMC